MTITVLGAGYVGLTTAALFAHAGYKVFAVEPNQTRLKVIKEGRSFFFEEGLDPVIKAALDGGSMIATDSYQESVPNSDVVISSVGTPDNPDGSSNLTYVFSAADEAGKLLKNDAVYVQKSTVPVGTGEKIEALFAKLGKQIAYVSNPEFLREGSALSDTLFFDRVVVGGNNNEALDKIIGIYEDLETQRDRIATLAAIDRKATKGQYIKTSRNSAELIKVTANAFLALKISFANSIAKLSDKVGADINEVMDAVGADKRIGRAFLSAGRGYGGGCFPKDVSGLIASGLEHGVELEIMHAAKSVNSSMAGYVIEKLKDNLSGDLRNKKIAVLGLAFKAGTSDTRRSPGIAMCRLLAKEGAIVKAYDPEANGEARLELSNLAVVTSSIEDALKDADCVLIATDWEQFKKYDPKDYKLNMAGDLFIDAMNCFEPSLVTAVGLRYVGIGRH